MGEAPVRVFISYSHDSKEHADRVLALADELRSKGLDAWIDQYEESPPQGWPLWCDQQIEQAQFIIAICTPTYRQRFEGKAPAGEGRGVGSEGVALILEMYEDQSRNKRILPVLFDGDKRDEAVPNRLRAGDVYALPQDFDRLYRRLTGQKLVSAPPVGSVLPMEPRDRRSIFSKPTETEAYLPDIGPLIGRNAEVKETVAALLTGEPVLLVGPGGIGKSTITIAALRDAQIVEKYGNRRYFVDLSAAQTNDAVVGELARVLGVAQQSDLRTSVFAELRRAPAVVVLDNLETPWEQSGESAHIEKLLSQLEALKSRGVALAGSIRGNKQPGGVVWRKHIQVGRLNREESRQLFLAIAGAQLSEEPLLEQLLKELDGLPLAIALIARVAQGEEDLEPVWKRWKSEKALLSVDTAKHLTAGASFELIINSPRMNDGARSLLRMLSLLPTGALREWLDQLMPEGAWQARDTLLSVGLVFEETNYLRLLQPLRAHVASVHPPTSEEAQRVVMIYMRIAEELRSKLSTDVDPSAVAVQRNELERYQATNRGTSNSKAAVENGERIVRRSKRSKPLLALNSQNRDARYEFHVAVSFAEEQRSFVRRTVRAMVRLGLTVFYDDDLQHVLWGKDLIVYLDEVYREKARYCIIFASKQYAKKLWTSHERKSAQARDFKSREDYLLPVRMDGARIKGLLDTKHALDGQKLKPSEIARHVLMKIESDNEEHKRRRRRASRA